MMHLGAHISCPQGTAQIMVLSCNPCLAARADRAVLPQRSSLQPSHPSWPTCTARDKERPAPDALLQAEAVLEEQDALVAHLLQLQLQPQVVLDLLGRVVVAQPPCVCQVLQTSIPAEATADVTAT